MDWRKEIKLSDLLRRQKKPKLPGLPPFGGTAASGRPADPKPPHESIWKREIKLSSLFRRKKAVRLREQLALPLPGDTVPEAPKADETETGWDTPGGGTVAGEELQATATEHEVSMAGDPDAVEEAADIAADEVREAGLPADAEAKAAAPQEPVLDESGAMPAKPRQSFWKRKIALGRKPAKAAATASRASGREKPKGRSKNTGRGRRDGESTAGRRRHGGVQRRSQRGLKLPDVPLMKAMNLLPKDVQLAATTLRPGVLQAAIVFVAVLLLGGVGLLYVTARQGVSEKEEILADKTSELEILQAQQLPSEADDTTLAGEALARATALSAALQGRMNWDRILRELSLTLPANVWFESFVTTNPVLATSSTATGAPAATGLPAGATLTINGYAGSQADVGYLLSRLSIIPEFSRVQLSQSGRTEIGTTQVYKFTVVGTFKQPGQTLQQAPAVQTGQVTP